MALPAQKIAAPTSGPLTRKLKKGELLFGEGENSRAMYFVKTGMIRIFKKKGDSSIEIDTVRAGSVLGELAFLDGNPRSASAEALTDCELNEISGPTFSNVLASMPDWLKILLKTVVGRLRTASTRIRQLEQASTAFDYSDKDGKRSAHYVYLSPHDVLKIASAVLLAGTRGNKEVKETTLKKYANHVMGIPEAKITTLLDVFTQVGIVKPIEGQPEKVLLNDPDFLEGYIGYLVEENLLEPSKRHDVSLKGFVIMSLIVKHLGKFTADEKTGLTKVNVAEIKKLETAANAAKEPFRMDEFPELVKLSYCSNIAIKSNDEAFTEIKAESFVQAYRRQRLMMAISAVNEQKRKGGNTGK